MKVSGRRRDFTFLIAGLLIAAMLISPVGAHVTNSVSHLWSDHIKPKVTGLVYTKSQSDAKFLGKTAKAADADKLDGKDSTAFATPAEQTHLVGDPGEVAFNDGSVVNPGEVCFWQNFDGDHRAAGYFKDGDDVVHLQGVVKAVDGSIDSCGVDPGPDAAIFVLPGGYAPAKRAVLTTISNNAVSRVNVDPNGIVRVEESMIGNAEFFLSLDGLSFRADG